MRRLAAALLALCALMSLAGTASAQPPQPQPPLAPTDRAAQLLDAVVAGNYAAVTADFDPTMRKRLTPQALGSAWTTYQEVFGLYQSHDDPQQVPRGDLTVVSVPLDMAKQPGEFRLKFHGDGTIAGLYFLKAGVPIP
ncbi:hypothetical protein ABIA30_002792 [Mycobacterium sp. MAA66]|uniref:DUF3887 domain-containing protein n=1 Tax=Mycobacterium sp. MAA66 TaxID=3156297 RepID=UPI00351664D4